MSQVKKRTRWSSGCLIPIGVLLLLIVVAAVLVGVARSQIGTMKAETHLRSEPTDGIPPADPELIVEGAPLLVDLRLHTVALILTPIADGSEVTVEASYDPAYYLLTQEAREIPGRRELRIELAPSGSALMALLRAKLGAPLPTLRLGIPRDVSMAIVGEEMRSISFMELGGTSVERVDMRVTDGSLKLHVAEPMRRPMELLRLYGSKGSITASALGNASPRRTRIVTHIGALDLDFRGAWVDDGQIDVLGAVAGGTIWLPEDVNLIGFEDSVPRSPQAEPELLRPTLTVDVDERVGRILVMR